MASSTRSGRRATTQAHQPQPDLASLSNVERLLVAQAVYELGAAAWPSVAKLLSKHPLISRPRSFFTPQSCYALYNQLLSDAELTGQEDINAPRSQTNLKLAQKHYRARVTELRSLILEEEVKFNKLVKEIDEIRVGQWDARIRAKLTGQPIPARQEEPSHPAEPKEKTGTPTSERLQQDEGHATNNPISPDDASSLEYPEPTHRITRTYLETGTNMPAEEMNLLQAMKGSARVLVRGGSEASAGAELDMDQRMKSPGASADNKPDDTRQIDEADLDVRQEGPTELVTADTADGTDGNRRESFTSSIREPSDSSSPQAFLPARRREGKRKTSVYDTSDSQRDAKRAREDSEEDEPEPNTPVHRRRRDRLQSVEDRVATKRFQTVITMLHTQISAHRNGNIFHNPIKPSEAPDYHEIVKRPMDLKTIKAKIKDGQIINSLEFQRDVYLMFANAMMYNRPNSDICIMTEEMMVESEGHINTFRQTEGFAQRTQRA